MDVWSVRILDVLMYFLHSAVATRSFVFEGCGNENEYQHFCMNLILSVLLLKNVVILVQLIQYTSKLIVPIYTI